jgi:hypothetical protein
MRTHIFKIVWPGSESGTSAHDVSAFHTNGLVQVCGHYTCYLSKYMFIFSLIYFTVVH